MAVAGKQGILLGIIVLIPAYLYYQSRDQLICSPVVSTNYGQVRGVESISRDGRKFYSYLGIPYAKPPINELRFESPQPPGNWSNIKDVAAFGPECAQVEFVLGLVLGTEDCLFLNVFTPKVDGKLLPVMVYIHGGLFVSGSGSTNHGPDYMMDEDIVLVTINYRLGSLGFLNTGDGIIRGNMGLKDQSFALKWVQENIEGFGGDRTKVTLFGNSAGGASVHYQMLSPMSKDLFQKAISQSGTALGMWALRIDPKTQAKRYAQRLSCDEGKTGEDVVSCLKKVPIQQILESHLETMDLFRPAITLFGPTIELHNDSQTFLSQHPYKIMSSGNMQRKPWITGYASHEGLFFSSAAMKNESLLKTLNSDFTGQMGNFLLFQSSSSPEFMKQVQYFYFGPHASIESSSQIENLTNLATDYVFATGFDESLRLQSKHAPVYPYFYTYKGEYSVTNLLLAVTGRFHVLTELLTYLTLSVVKRKIWGSNNLHNYGACHADELRIFFRASMYDEINGSQDKDYIFSKELIKLWVEFASTNRDIIKLHGKEEWHPLSTTHPKYLRLDSKFSHIDPPYQDRLKFWRKMNLFKNAR